MTTISLQIDDRVAHVLAELSRERGLDEQILAAEVLAQFTQRESMKREELPPELLKAAAEFLEEDRQLAEAGMDDYAAGLAREDEA